jgi:ribonucleoside-triphosphate reductase
VYNVGTSTLRPKAETAAPAAPVETPVETPVEAPAAVSCEGTKAILISRVTCPNCRVAENLLNKAGIAYEKLIAEEHADLCRQYGVKGAPTLIITDGENHQNHYSVPEIKKYLASL